MKIKFGRTLIKLCLVGTTAGMLWGYSSLPFLTPAWAEQTAGQYTVVRGDTLWAIANRLGTTVAELKSANGLQGDLIQPGQVLTVPGAETAAAPAAEEPEQSAAAADKDGASSADKKTYTVAAGDTLWSIAEVTGVPVAVLKRANNVQNDFLAIGQELVIPEEPAVQAAPSRSGDRVQTILDYARSLEGQPYRWGGSAPGGFDCSGFVVHVFSRHGISLPRTSFDQFKAGTAVSRSDLRPGDLVFFTTYKSGPSHVGIYYGNGRFLHASSAGGRVIWTNLNEHQYYSSRFLGGRRVVP